MESGLRTKHSDFGGGDPVDDTDSGFPNPDSEHIRTAAVRCVLCSPGGSIILGRGLRSLIASSCTFVHGWLQVRAST